MERSHKNLQTFFGRDLHKLLFFDEFTFSQNTFSPPASSGLELADAIVMLGDTLIVQQIKERDPKSVGDALRERSWFEKKVIRDATKQVRATLAYLQDHPKIEVKNERGRTFNLAATNSSTIIKIVIYLPSRNLPHDCLAKRHHFSQSSGIFIHIISSDDYMKVAETLRVPRDFIDYFQFRDKVLCSSLSDCCWIEEAAFVGQFISGKTDTIPALDSAKNVDRLTQDHDAFDPTPYLFNLRNQSIIYLENSDYYDILVEFAKISRAHWRAVKGCVDACLSAATANLFVSPYRLSNKDTSCGFVFVVVVSDFSQRDDWETKRFNALGTLMQHHMYDQRLSRCVGMQVEKAGDHLDITWAVVKQDWKEDAVVEEAVAKNSLLRPIESVNVSGYILSD